MTEVIRAIFVEDYIVQNEKIGSNYLYIKFPCLGFSRDIGIFPAREVCFFESKRNKLQLTLFVQHDYPQVFMCFIMLASTMLLV